MMAIVLIAGAGLGWFIQRVTVQRDAVKAIEADGGKVRYDFQQKAWFLSPTAPSPGPKWLVDFLGVDFLANVTSVTLKNPQGDAILAHVGRLRRLDHLDAGPTRVTDVGLAQLSGLSELRSLSCSGTPELTDAGLAHLAGLRKLESLLIYDPKPFEGQGLAHLAGLDRLKYLSIHTKSDLGVASLSRLTGLRKLSFGMENVTDAGLAQLSRLTWLNELYVGGETGTVAGMIHLRSLTDLDILQLHGPWLTDAGLVPVAEMDHLSTFFVSDQTSVTDGGLNQLQRRRPRLRIGVNGTGKVPRARTDLLRRAVGPNAIRDGSR